MTDHGVDVVARTAPQKRRFGRLAHYLASLRQVRYLPARRTTRIFVVLGMHRSGTSAITRALQALGIELGEHLMPASQANEKGFFEDTEVYKLNVALLAQLGQRWDSLCLIPPQRFDNANLAPFKAEAAALLKSRISRHTWYGMKDPRMTRLLPFWQHVFQHLSLDVSYVVAFRHPLSVAASLHSKFGMRTEKSCYLWQQYVLACFAETAPVAALVVDYDRLMDQPAKQLTRMARALGVPFDSASPATREYCHEFLSERLRHARHGLPQLQARQDVPPDVIDTYRMLDALATDSAAIAGRKTQRAFAKWSDNMRRAIPLLNYANVLEDQLATAHDARTPVADLASALRRIDHLEQAFGDLAERHKRQLADVLEARQAAKMLAKSRGETILDLKLALQAMRQGPGNENQAPP